MADVVTAVVCVGVATVVVYVVVAMIPPDLVRVNWGVPLNTNVSVKMYGMTKVTVV